MTEITAVKNQVRLLKDPIYFEAWKQLMRAQLEYEEPWDVVNPTARLELDKNEALLKKDREALFLIKKAIDPSELVKTGLCLSPAHLWRKLQENYEGSKQAMVSTISAEWAVFGAKQKEDLITYLGRFE